MHILDVIDYKIQTQQQQQQKKNNIFDGSFAFNDLHLRYWKFQEGETGGMRSRKDHL